MNSRDRSFRRKIVYLVALAVLLGVLSWLGRPSTTGARQGSPGGMLAQLREKEQLNAAELGEIDPTSETIKLATLGMRGIAANVLWKKANDYKMKKDWTNLSATLEQIIRVQPNFVSVWQFQGWNLSFNVSNEFDDFHERYRWVIRGIHFLEKGIAYNEHSPRLEWDVAHTINQKIGRSDEKKQFRRLFVHDDDFHGDREPGKRDNWLVGRQWYQKAEWKVDTQGDRLVGQGPIIWRSSAPMCLMSYGRALEEDGDGFLGPVFGPVARQAWKAALDNWVGNKELNIEGFGQKDIPTSSDAIIRLNDEERYLDIEKEKAKEIEALQPGLREEIFKERYDTLLTAEQRAAYDTKPEDRKDEQFRLAAEAEAALKVTHRDVAKRIKGADRKEALRLADEATEAQGTANLISRYRSIVNFVYWGERARIEQQDQTLDARRTIYQGDLKYEEPDMPAARKFYEEGFAIWRRVLDANPAMLEDDTFGSEMMDVIKRYRNILSQLDLEFPKPFILQDVVDKHGQKQK